MALIELNNITKEYVLSEKVSVKALNDVSLTINKGELLAIVGKSGSGKSTLLNVISCMDSRFTGKYIFNKESILEKTNNELAEIRNKNFGFIFQNFNLLTKLTAYENIEIPLIYKKVARKKRKEIIYNIAKSLEIEDRLIHKPSELSGGEQQRVAIARALVTNPEIIIADEPTGALDVKTGKQILDILINLQKNGKTVLIVTHDQELANLADRKITLSDGKIIFDSKEVTE